MNGITEAAFHSLAADLEDSVYLKDGSGSYVAVNPAFARWLGRPQAEVVGRTASDLWPHWLAERDATADQAVLRDGEPLDQEETWLRGQQPRTVRVVRTPIRDDNGIVLGLLATARDVTPEEVSDDTRRQTERMELLGRLAGGVAHDFNNLLTVILGNASLVLESAGPNDPRREAMTAIRGAATQASELTSHLLAFARQETRQSEPVDLNAAVERMVNLLRRTLDPLVTVDLRPQPALPAVQADRGQLAQVLLNLCLNARDAMPRGGRLLLETVAAPLGAEDARQHPQRRPGAFVRLRVADTGEGMSPAVLARIFDSAFTTKPAGKGTGLGLSIVRDVVRQHGGWVECRSKVGEGTCFDVYLPAAKVAVSPPAPGSHGSMARGRETILLVDNEPAILQLGRAMLAAHGYDVLLAQDGRQALEIYRQNRGRIALVLLDQTMPQMGGADALAELRKLNPDLRVVMVSGYSSEELPDEVRRAVRGFLAKPFTRGQFLRAVQAALAPDPQHRVGGD